MAALGLALAASPAYVVRFKVGIPTTLLEVLLVLAVLLGLAALGGSAPWRNQYTWPALAFLLGATIDVLFSPDRRAAAGIWKAYFIEPALAAIVIAGLCRTRERAVFLLGALGVAGLIVAGANLGADAGELYRRTFNLVVPPVSIYTSANAVPLYLVPLDAVALAVLLHGEERRERLAAAGFLVITAAAVILSLSRAGWAALLAVAVFVSLFHRWRLRVLVGVLAVALVGVVAVPPIRRRVEVELDPTSPFNTIRLRLALWKSAIEMLKHHPLFGGGLSGFARSVEPYRDRNYGERLIYPHNIVLNFWSETGLIGLLGFAWLCAWMVRTSWRGLGSTGMGRVISIGVLGMLVAFAVHGIADVPYFKNDQALAFWALLGIQVGVLRQPLAE